MTMVMLIDAVACIFFHDAVWRLTRDVNSLTTGIAHYTWIAQDLA